MAVTREEFMAVCRDRDEAVLAIPKWISVSQRLPEKGTNVITARWSTACLDNPKLLVDVARFSGGTFQHLEAQFVFEPTHWMPLPEPPEVK